MKEAQYLQTIAALLHRQPVEASLQAQDSHALAQHLQNCALRFYARSAAHRRRYFVNHVYQKPMLDAMSAEAREHLLQAYLQAQGGTNRDWSHNAQRFCQVVEHEVRQGSLHPCWQDAATHCWTLYRTGLHQQSPPAFQKLSQLRINPTFEIMAYRYDPTQPNEASPLAESTTPTINLGYYLHPTSYRAHWQRIDESILAACQIVDSKMALDSAAQQAGLSLEELRTILERLAKQGLFVAAEP